MISKMEKAISILLTTTLLLSILIAAIPVHAQSTIVRFEPLMVEVYGNGVMVTMACVVEDVTGLQGLDIVIDWDGTYLQYISHTVTIPVESFPAPNPPSPYAGIIHSPELALKNEFPDASSYWVAYATLGGPDFAGNGTVFVMTWMTQNVPFGNPLDYFDSLIQFTSVDLASGTGPIPHTAIDGIVRIHHEEQTYPIHPCLKVVDPVDGDATIECEDVNGTVSADVLLMGKNKTSGALGDLAAFWDVGGMEFVMHFNTTLLEATAINIDPDGWFAGFFASGIFVTVSTIDNVAGTATVGFTGLDRTVPPQGVGRVASVDFISKTESDSYPPACSPIYLENEQIVAEQMHIDAASGLIDLTNPIGEVFNEVAPLPGDKGPFTITGWTDDDGDGEVSAGDHITMEEGAGNYFQYVVEEVAGSGNFTLAKSAMYNVWVANFGPDNLYYNGLPGSTIFPMTGNPYNGVGVPYWVGNFTTTYPVASVDTITVHEFPFTGDEVTWVATDGVDYVAHDADNLIELLHPLDVDIINEHWMDGVNNSLNGWPYINYVASGISDVYVDMNNGTARPGRNLGYAMPPPAEWWYDPDWAWEVEGWWALGYFCPAPWCWPAGSEWWVNYTAASTIDVVYNTDEVTSYVEFVGTYPDFLAALAAPVGEFWQEVFPFPFAAPYEVLYWTDGDASTDLSVGDFLEMPGAAIFRVDGLSTDLVVRRKPWICDTPGDKYFGEAGIVSLAGIAHPDRDFCPWHAQPYSIQLPHLVENAEYCECFVPAGGFIDVYTQWPGCYGGEGLYQNSSMIWPQKNLTLCANVTTAGWPEQNKDVAFQVIDPHGETWGIWVNRTDDWGVTCVFVRMPWPCDDPEYYFGVWTVIATVDVACVVVNDTLHFKYDYKVHIWDAYTDKDSYKHCEDIIVTINYGTYSMMYWPIVFSITAVDSSGVPFGFAYDTVIIGKGECRWCDYENGTLVLTVHVEKWARPPVGKIYVVALNGLPSEGGSAETPVFEISFGILPEWA
jgi:hypothetical protein